MLADIDVVPLISGCVPVDGGGSGLTGSVRYDGLVEVNDAAGVPSANGDPSLPNVTAEYWPSPPWTTSRAVDPVLSLSRKYASGDAPSTLLTKTWLDPATLGWPMPQMP